MASRSSRGEQTQRPLQAERHTSALLLLLMVMMMMMMSAHAEQSVCDATEDATCSGEAGRPVYLQLSKDTKGRQLKLYRNRRVFTYKGSKSAFFEAFNTTSVLQRWQFVPDNGTMIINPVERRDAGTYRVEIFDKEGKLVGEHTVQLIIEGVNPVVPVLVTLVLLLVCVAGGVFYFYRRKNAHTHTQRTSTTAAPEELHYAVVDITQRRQEDYKPSAHTHDCVYAQVQPAQ